MKNNAMSMLGIQIDLKAHMLSFEGMCKAVRDAAEMGYNTVLLEYQDKFPFEGELSCVAAPDALTKKEIAAFDALCSELGLEIVPLVQCIGHMHYVLRNKAFEHLADACMYGVLALKDQCGEVGAVDGEYCTAFPHAAQDLYGGSCV